MPGRQIVVCGFPRGGTSLLYNMLSSSLDGFGFAEFEVAAWKVIARWGDFASKKPLDVLILDDLVRRNIHGKRLVAIVMLRDPRDLITSVHPNVPDRYFLDYEGSWTPHARGPRREPYGIRAIHAAIQRAQRIEGMEVILVRYEDLVADPDRIQQALAARIGVEFNSRFSDFHRRPERHAYRYAGKNAPKDPSLVRENSAVDRSRHGKWNCPEHAARIARHFQEHPGLFELVRQLGYEQDDSWFAPFRRYVRLPP